MARYPEFPIIFPTNIYAVVTVGSIKRPDKGDIAYSVSAGKFKGYVSTAGTQAWQDLN